MEAELAALANAGAATLTGLMISDSWAQAKERFAQLFARHGAEGDTLLRLETSRAQLVAGRADGDVPSTRVIEAEWRARLHHLLLSDSTMVDELRDLLAQSRIESAGPVCNSNTGDVRLGGVVVQAGQISGMAFHVVEPSATDQCDDEKEIH